MSTMLNIFKKTGIAMAAAAIITATSPAPAMAFGHAAADKARNAALSVVGIAVAAWGIRRLTRGRHNSNTLG